MSYTHDGITHRKIKSRFWLNEQEYWLCNGTSEEKWVDVTSNYLTIGKTPTGVSDILYKIKYRYNQKSYACLTDNPSLDVSKLKPPEMKFKMPIKNVYLIDENDKIIRNVTKKYMKLLGPNGDFHNYLVPKVYDLFAYNDYKYIQITNIVNITKNVDINSTLDQLL